jgi:hypothetical protein
VRKVTLGKGGVESLWGDRRMGRAQGRSSTDQAFYASAGLGSLNRLVDITTHSVQLPTIMSLFRNNSSTLKTFSFETLNLTHTDYLGEALSVSSSLEELRVTSIDDYGPDAPFDLSPAQRSTTSLPPLRSLSITSSFPDDSHLAFSHAFSATLTHLSLSWVCCPAPPDVPPSFSNESFPSVVSLSFGGTFEGVSRTLSTINPRHFPALQTVELELVGVADWTAMNSPLRPLTAFSTLAHLRIGNLPALSSAATAAIRSFCSDNNLTLTGGKENDVRAANAALIDDDLSDDSPPSSRETTPPSSPPSGSPALGADIGKTIKFLQKKLEQLKKEDDQRELRKVQTMLRPAELERQAGEVWERM